MSKICSKMVKKLPHIQKMAKLWPPIQNFFTLIYNKLTLLYNTMAFSRPHIQNMSVSRPYPLYNKIAFLRPHTKNGILETPYTTKWHFRDPRNTKNGIFETPLYNNMTFLWPPIQQNCHWKKLTFIPSSSPFLKWIAFIVFSYRMMVNSWYDIRFYS